MIAAPRSRAPELPPHLKRYVVEQDYSRYTPVDQEVWRYIMRQLKSFLAVNAHPCYLSGLEKTGILPERIPEISAVSECLEKFGWHAIPVSGFIPPAAFMELQALGYLPIASDMRAIDHLMYTPAPDIVHEAAGHAPILVDTEYAEYLRDYAQVARKALMSRHDLNQYEAIRVLSDLKEDANSTPEQIKQAERKLAEVTNSIPFLSEAAYLSRMNWWTAEYGLVGTLEKPKIFGAGLLSSLGEARSCMTDAVKKLPLTIDCIQFAYDITEPQPQLFVTPDFAHLRTVLSELAATMAFRVGGAASLAKAKQSQTVNTIELDSGIQISGQLQDYVVINQQPAYLQFTGPTQLCENGVQLEGHGPQYHSAGFGSPLGLVRGEAKSLSDFNSEDLSRLGLREGQKCLLSFQNGCSVSGAITSFLRGKSQKLMLISWRDCTVTLNGKLMFDPAWGTFDMAVGTCVPSVYGGPADREAFGDTDDFVAKQIPRKTPTTDQKKIHSAYEQLAKLRRKSTEHELENLIALAEVELPEDWLLMLGIFESACLYQANAIRERALQNLNLLANRRSDVRESIHDGLLALAAEGISSAHGLQS